MSYRKNCHYCGAQFTTSNQQQEYCCDACQNRRNYLRRRKSIAEYKERPKITCQKCWARMKKKGNKYVCPDCKDVYTIDSLGRIHYTSILEG